LRLPTWKKDGPEFRRIPRTASELKGLHCRPEALRPSRYYSAKSYGKLRTQLLKSRPKIVLARFDEI